MGQHRASGEKKRANFVEWASKEQVVSQAGLQYVNVQAESRWWANSATLS